jgi:hypothetical protein
MVTQSGNYIVPARESTTASVTVTAGDVHRALKFDSRRMPLACAAINTAKFERQYGVRPLTKKWLRARPNHHIHVFVHSAGERNPGSPLVGGEHDMGTT